MALLAIQQAVLKGTAIPLTAAAGGGDTFARPHAQVGLRVKNGGGAAPGTNQGGERQNESEDPRRAAAVKAAEAAAAQAYEAALAVALEDTLTDAVEAEPQEGNE